MNTSSPFSALLLGACIALGLAALGYQLAEGVVRFRAMERTVSVKGLAEREVFICGPLGFMADAANRLTALGVPAGRIRQESFGGALLSVARPHQAVQLHIGEREFAGNNQGTVLDQANKQGVELPWSCRAGICGSCKQTLVSGEVDHPDAPAISAAERAEGKILACCAVPLTDLVIK